VSDATTEGPFRVGRSWGVTVVYDPDFDPDTPVKTGTLMATAQNPNFAQTIVAALNERHQRRTRGSHPTTPRLH
jgi:hypothetical protein